MKTIRSRIVGVGSYLPERVVTNHELAQRIDTSDAWIVERSGIRERHIAAEGQFTSHLAIEAARKALDSAGMTEKGVDLIVLATATPDNTFPSTAARVQAALGMKGGAAFDVQAVCCGFLYALATADNFIKSGQVRSALVIGAETFSRILDWTDRGTCILFGDGAGAVVLRAETGTGGPADHGILSTRLHADGSLYDLLYVDGGPSSTQTVGHLKMVGRDVFRHAVGLLSDVALEVLADNDLTIDAVDWMVPHQANRRIIESTGRKLGLPAERVIVTIEKHGNTSAASVPLALSAAVADGRVQPGQLLLFEALGGGMAWGAALVRF